MGVCAVEVDAKRRSFSRQLDVNWPASDVRCCPLGLLVINICCENPPSPSGGEETYVFFFLQLIFVIKVSEIEFK